MKISKKTGIGLGVAAVAVIAVMFMIIALFSGGKINTSTTRQAWEASPLANSQYFETEEVADRAENDKVYVRVEGVEPLVAYVCKTYDGGVSKSCQVEVDGTSNDEKQFGLSGYFWSLHKTEIQALLAKYGENLDKWPSRWTDVQINVYNNDTKSAKEFVRELLQIPDMKKLYLAYKDEVQRTNSTNAYIAFGYFWLDFYANDSNKDAKLARYNLFDWALEQGL